MRVLLSAGSLSTLPQRPRLSQTEARNSGLEPVLMWDIGVADSSFIHCATILAPNFHVFAFHENMFVAMVI